MKLLFFFLFFFVSFAGAGSLLLHVPGASTKELKEALSKESGLSQVQAFGKIKDLQRKMKKTPDAAILAPGVFVDLFTDYKVLLEGINNKATGETYYLVTNIPNMESRPMTELKVGMLDFVGRKNVKIFLQKTFNGNFQSVRRVTKTEDLLTMLGMKTVDAIAMSESDLSDLKRNTKLKIHTLKRSRRTVATYPVLAVRKKNGYIDASVKNLSTTNLKKLGISGWRQRK